MAGWGAALRRWFDYETDPARPVPFALVANEINLRRVALGVALSLVNLLGQIYLAVIGEWTLDSFIALGSIPVEAAVLALVVVRPAILDQARWQRALTMFTILFALVTAEFANAAIASNGRLTSGYALILMATALLFLFPLRTSVSLFGIPSAIVMIVAQAAPVPHWEKVVATINVGVATIVAIVANWLIYTTRERDHDQRQLIHAQATQLAARKQQLDELMAITAHDLQSPLMGLHNLFDLAIEKAPANPALPLRVMRDSQPSLQAMLQLVRRLLLAHKTEHDPGATPVHEDLRLHVAAAVERIQPLARSAGVIVAADLAPSPIFAVFDPIALAQIFDNLLANAVRFSSADDAVVAHCACAGGIASIAIVDSGPGIPEEERAHLFRKFRRGGTVPRHGPPGTGIGLFIVATLAERIGATIAYRTALPQGSRFELTLPYVP